MASLKYSAFGSPLAFTNGSTATESMVSPPRLATLKNQLTDTSKPSITTAAIPRAALLRHGHRVFAGKEVLGGLTSRVASLCVGAACGNRRTAPTKR